MCVCAQGLEGDWMCAVYKIAECCTVPGLFMYTIMLYAIKTSKRFESSTSYIFAEKKNMGKHHVSIGSQLSVIITE